MGSVPDDFVLKLALVDDVSPNVRPEYDLVHGHPKSININLRVQLVYIPVVDLARSVGDCVGVSVELGLRLQIVCLPKVRDLSLEVLGNENIAGLDVQVHNVLLLQEE